ncbi:phosphoglucosamine mutase, partial [Candidatus Saccharibacteria bacterium]|nr:phosphoglucosamine mutase [Candidatus Saccharibacteria bacterium]
YFGTDGIRCKADLLTTEFIAKIAKGLTRYAESRGIDTPRVFLAGDTRESSEWILQDFCRAFETLGVEYSCAGVLPTPAINYAFYEMGFDFAVDVTASHNPHYDNGVKVSERGEKFGVKLGAEGREIVERELTEGQNYELVAATLREDLHEDALDRYMNHLREYVGKVDFSGLRIGVDCANGAQGVIGGKIFEELGAEVVVINDNVNYGTAINDGCGSTHLEALAELVKREGLDLGVAFDGDGDRCMMVDGNGEEVDGDQILVVLTEFLQLNGLAVTVMANQGLIEWAQERGVKLEVTPVGDQHVSAAMRKYNIQLGGEQCGHVVLPGEPFGDGMLVGLMVTKAVAVSKRSLAELAGAMTKFPQIIRNMNADDEQKKLLEGEKAAAIIKEFEEKLAPVKGRLLVRPSGTEPVVRITMW